ncbi:LysE family translocator [Pseudomaricurvus alkylphenolicus]|jgi:threonine/homoserine/homoserine lactone efflux protein|uniref:LysE family translocator n=1 Tax=Pseudomaricurvus alkylphenolicus TaxID=1306991 RepID=UPI00141E928E|nr:LysE family translocator [Pseudomaricurvus alkylphenolicus]NIB42594.1 LysE family translocator [Pseudomaricurvus alkylphenolicus]
MDTHYFASLMLFVFSVSVTPGPNNLMVTASGSNFGYLRTLPHIVGITTGFTLLIISVAAGLGTVFINLPSLQMALKVCGAAYLLWLAWKITTAPVGGKDRFDAKPLSFTQAFMFQWVNPKAWTMGITGISAFAVEGQEMTLSLILITAAFAVVVFPVCSFWALLGEQVSRWLTSERAHRWFNRSLGLLTAFSVVLIVN